MGYGLSRAQFGNNNQTAIHDERWKDAQSNSFNAKSSKNLSFAMHGINNSKVMALTNLPSQDRPTARPLHHGTSHLSHSNESQALPDSSKVAVEVQIHRPEHNGVDLQIIDRPNPRFSSRLQSQQQMRTADSFRNRSDGDNREPDHGSKQRQPVPESPDRNEFGSKRRHWGQGAFGKLKRDHRLLQNDHRELEGDFRILEYNLHSSAKNFRETVSQLNGDNSRKDEQLEEKSQKISALESMIVKLKNHIKQQEYSHNRTGDRLKQDLTRCNQQLEELQEEKEEMARALEKCKDRIFNNQPVQGMADSQLRDMYTDMCNSIDYWVENQFEDTEQLLTSLANAGTSRGARGLVNDYFTSQELVAIQENPFIESMMLQALISRHLYFKLLEEHRIFPGLSPGTESCLHAVIKGLSALKPAKDVEAIRMWRVDMQRTFSTVESFKDARGAELQRITTALFECLQSSSNMAGLGNGEQEQCYRIVLAAAELANNVRQSMELYDFAFPFAPGKTDESGNAIRLQDLKKFKVIDSRTGSGLRPSAAPVAGPDGQVGRVLFVVHPAFTRKSTTSGAKIVLAKSTIVVKFDQPVPRAGKEKS